MLFVLTGYTSRPPLVEGITRSDDNSLHLCIVVQCVLAKLTTNTRLLEAAEGSLIRKTVVCVHPDGTSLDAVGNLERSIDVLGVDSRGETYSELLGPVLKCGATAIVKEYPWRGLELTKLCIISDPDSLGFVLEGLNNADRAEDLFLDDAHILRDIGEDGGLDVVTLVTNTLTTDLADGTGLLALFNVAQDLLKLAFVDLRTLEGILVEGVTNLVLQGTLLEGSDELIVDLLLDNDTRTSTANLAVIVVDTVVHPGNGIVEICICEDDIGGLATKLEGNLLEVTLSSGLEDLTTNESRTSEGDLVNAHVV